MNTCHETVETGRQLDLFRVKGLSTDCDVLSRPVTLSNENVAPSEVSEGEGGGGGEGEKI